jgi:translation initiation factor IF-1
VVGYACAQSAPATPERQRYAILMAYALKGSRNVRYETVPMRLVDQNGKPVGHRGGDGSTSFSCTDVQGKERKHGEEYERPNGKFKYKCDNGNEIVTACVGSERANKAHIAVGENLDVNGFWHKCQSFENGSVVYTQENSCRDPHGKELHIGDTFVLANLRFACGDGKYEIIGCSFKSTSGQDVSLNPGETKEDGKLTHLCESKDGTLQYSAKGDGCTRRGKEYKEGETFQENHLKYKCVNGIVDITGCYVNENKDLNVGQDFAENGILHRCYRLGGTIEYTENMCAGSSCNPPPIDSGPDEVPTLGRGLKSPGVHSFSIVSSGSPPATIKLDLDKVLMGQQRN